MDRRTAIRECKKLWAEIGASGLSKKMFVLHTPEGEVWTDKHYTASCPLCEYVERQHGSQCSCCPLKVQLGEDCNELAFWAVPEDHKFLDAVKRLKVH